MTSNNIRALVPWYTWTSDDQWNVDISIVRTAFARLHSVLPDMEAVVGRVNDECIFKDTVFIECGDQLTYHVINACQNLKTSTIEAIIVIYI